MQTKTFIAYVFSQASSAHTIHFSLLYTLWKCPSYSVPPSATCPPCHLFFPKGRKSSSWEHWQTHTDRHKGPILYRLPLMWEGICILNDRLQRKKLEFILITEYSHALLLISHMVICNNLNVQSMHRVPSFKMCVRKSTWKRNFNECESIDIVNNNSCFFCSLIFEQMYDCETWCLLIK